MRIMKIAKGVTLMAIDLYLVGGLDRASKEVDQAIDETESTATVVGLTALEVLMIGMKTTLAILAIPLGISKMLE